MGIEEVYDKQENNDEIICPLTISVQHNQLTIPRAVIRKRGIKHGDFVFFRKEYGKFQLQLYRGIKDDSRCQ
jgi:hypothetical protein